MTLAGALTFARYAYPPNALGYCGPDDADALIQYADADTADGGLTALAREFEGAWPYLRHLATAAGHTDPLAAEVVEAYWLGGSLLDRAAAGPLAHHLTHRFGARAGTDLEQILDVVRAGGIPHHNFHVVAVSPWIGLLRAGHVDTSLNVLDRCRIRPATVVATDGDTLIVTARGLAWDGARLSPGEPADLTVRVARDGYRLAGASEVVEVGDVVAVHWDWVCARLTPAQHTRLVTTDARILAAASRTATGPAAGELVTV